MNRSLLVLGSWAAEIESDSEAPVRFLADNFKQASVRRSPLEKARTRIVFETSASLPGTSKEVPDDTIAVSERRMAIRLSTPLIEASATRKGDRVDARIVIRDGTETNVLAAHLTMVIRRFLLWMDLFYLHAGAVEWNGATSLFIGEKGAGKSTCCLRLARAGARLISEDHILVKRSGKKFSVSGSEGVGRVTSHSEHHLFAAPLRIDAQDYAGTMKKEFELADHFACAPGVDFPFQRLYFPSVGERFALAPVSSMSAALRLMSNARQFFRFQGTSDYTPFLDFFTGMTAKCKVYDLTLTPRLEDLDRLVEHVRHG